MTEDDTNPQQPGRPEPGAPERTADLSQPAGGAPASGAPAGSGDADASGPQAAQPERAGQPGPYAPPAAPPNAPYTPPAGPYAPSLPYAQPSPPAAPPNAPYAQPSPPAAPPNAPYAQPSPPYAPPSPPYAPPSPPSPWQQPSSEPRQSEWQQPASGVPGSGAPAYQPQPAAAAHQPPPIWAPRPGSGESPTAVLTPMGAPAGPGTYRPPSRAGRRVAAGVAVLALAVASGALGGWVAVQADDDPATTTNVGGSATNASNPNPAPVINRDDLANVAAAVLPSVVSIKTDRGEGSGVVYDDQGHIVTNNHVVASASGDTVTVIFSDGTRVDGRIVNTDAPTDLAVVEVSNVSGLTPAKFGDSGAMRVGDTVLALGSPLGLEGTVTEGIISALDRTIQVSDDERNPFLPQQVQSISGLLQTDAPINPGNSGGALANTKGEVIGINNAIAGNSGGNIGLGFAIPSNKVRAVADQLIKGGKVSHPFLGVSVTDATDGGALVRSVAPESPAAKAGLQEGDVVTKLGDKVIGDSDDLVSAVQGGNVGDRLELAYTRNGAQKTATVTLADAS